MSSHRIEIAKNDRRKIRGRRSIIRNDLLDHILRPSIRACDVASGTRFCNRQRGWIAINRCRRAENQVFDLIFAHGFQKCEGTVKVSSIILERLLNRFPDSLISRKVHDRIDLMLFENLFQIRRILNVHIIGSDTLSGDFPYPFRNLLRTVIEVICDDYIISQLKQFNCHMATDISRSASK